MYVRLPFGGCMKTSVLLVDDKPRMLKVISSALSGDQYELRFALNHNDALKEFKKKAPSFLLLDASSLSEDPWKLVHCIREVLRQNQVKILFLASHFFSLNEEQLDKYNINGVIKKPFTPEELRKKINSLREKKEKAQASSIHKDPALNRGPEVQAQVQQEQEQAQVQAQEQKQELEQEEESIVAEDFVFDPLEKHGIDQEASKVQIPGKEEIATAPEVSPPPSDPFVDNLLKDQQKGGTVPQEDVYFISKEDALQDDTWKAWLKEEVETAKEEDKQHRKVAFKNSKSRNSYFDIGDSKFSFSKDYIDRVGEQAQSYEGTEGSSNMEDIVPGRVFSSESKEKIFREETRKFCEKVINKVVSDMIPEITERIVKEKLEGVLDSLKEETT